MSTEVVSSCSEKTRRAVNWTIEEKAFTHDLIRSSDKLFSKFRGRAPKGGKEQNVEWSKITDQFGTSYLAPPSGNRISEIQNGRLCGHNPKQLILS